MTVPLQVALLVKKVTEQVTVTNAHPTLAEVKKYLEGCFRGAEVFAWPFYRAMKERHWQDRQRQPIRHWRIVALRYASRAYVNTRKREGTW